MQGIYTRKKGKEEMKDENDNNNCNVRFSWFGLVTVFNIDKGDRSILVSACFVTWRLLFSGAFCRT